MKIKSFLWLLKLFFGTAIFAFGQTTQVIYDPVKTPSQMKVSRTEESLIKRSALPKARQEWKNNENCGEDFRIVDAVTGSFTRKRAAQKAFVYEFCQTGNGWANNGLVIVESGKVIAHFVEEGGWNMGLQALPDINKNGLDELVVETSGGMHQGKIGGSITILEISTAAVREFGSTLAFSNECDAEESTEDCDRSYKITVKPALKPIFYREKFVNRGDDMKTRWKKSGRVQKVLLRKTESKYRLLK